MCWIWIRVATGLSPCAGAGMYRMERDTKIQNLSSYLDPLILDIQVFFEQIIIASNRTCNLENTILKASEDYYFYKMTSTKPIILHLGDPIEFNKDLYSQIANDFTVIRPSLEERQRGAFLEALREKKWGDFQAIFRPFWNTGGEMGRWDAELIPLLPPSLKVYASAGAGYDWMDVDILAENGESR